MKSKLSPAQRKMMDRVKGDRIYLSLRKYDYGGATWQSDETTAHIATLRVLLRRDLLKILTATNEYITYTAKEYTDRPGGAG